MNTLREATATPRDRLSIYGPENLPDHDLLSILIGWGNKDQDPETLAWELLRTCEGLGNLMRTSINDLGLGLPRGSIIQAALELGRRCALAERQNNLQIHSASDIAALLQSEMALLDQETLRVVILNTRHRILAIRELYRGSLATCVVRAAEVFRDAIKMNAAAIILAHNHPSGDPDPSPEDVRLTRELVMTGRQLDIELVDHLVIGATSYVSLRQKHLGFD